MSDLPPPTLPPPPPPLPDIEGYTVIGANEIIEALKVLDSNDHAIAKYVAALIQRVANMEAVIAAIVIQYPLIDPETGESTADTFGKFPGKPQRQMPPQPPGQYL